MSLNARVFVFASEGYSDGYAFCTSSFPGPQKGIVAYADLKYAAYHLGRGMLSLTPSLSPTWACQSHFPFHSDQCQHQHCSSLLLTLLY